ncbi:unnamed protein product, partial [Anisakis simplex]|uniref:Mannosyltransferase n=1 Tax=Anisakis simplex TaxID=6269 RepID=A0A0M3KHZ3_ANISI
MENRRRKTGSIHPSIMKMNVNMKMLLPVSILLLRLVNIFVVQTWFVPDELFQSVEVAYHVVFSTGHLAWEWTNSLRSIIHPYSIAIFYYLLKIFDLDSNFAIIFIPKLLHSLLFAMGDVCFYSLAKRLLPSFDAKFALFNYLTCWFLLYCAPRTLSNSVETALTLIACWPYMSIATLAILIRPTAVLIWIPLGLWHLVRSKSRLELIIFTCLPAMLPVLVVAFLLDSFAYGEWTFSAWNFAKFNVFQGGSAHFGTNPWHYFITNGLPAVLSVQLIPVISGCFVAIRYRQVTLSLLLTSLFYITFHSGLAHKEHRFLLPIIPFLCIYAGHFFGYLRRAG